MPLPSTVSGTSFSTATCVGAWIEYPFRNQGDSTTKIYVHQMQVLNADYVPLNDNDTMTAATQKPVRSPFPDDAAAYYVGDSQPAPTDGGLVFFERRFANIPQDRTMANDKAEPIGQRAFSYPETEESIVTFTTTANESTSFTGLGQNDGYWTITCDLAPADVATLAVDDIVDIIHNNDVFSVTLSGGTYFGTYTKKRLKDCKITNITSNTITLTTNFGGPLNRIVSNPYSYLNVTATDDGTITTFNVEKVAVRARFERLDVNAPHFLESRYIKTNDYFELNTGLQEKFTPLNNLDNIMASNDNLDGDSEPTANEYGELVYFGGYINAEPESIRRWMGNIFVKELLKVKAL